MGDDFKRVRTGDQLRIPARTWNTMLDGTRARAQSGTIFAGGSGASTERDNVKMCYGAFTGQPPAPWPAQTLPPRVPVYVYGHWDFERLQASAPNWQPALAHQHGITLEPIRYQSYGLVAITGGPYKCRIIEPTPQDEVVTGTLLGIHNEGGVWALKKSATGHFVAVTPSVEDPQDGNLYSWVVIGSAGSTTLYGRAQVDMVSPSQKYPVYLARGGGSWTGDTVDCYPMWRRVVPAGTNGVIAFDYVGEMVFFDTCVILPYLAQDPATVPDGFMWLRSDL